MNFLDRLTDYDLFAYIPPGFMALTAVDYIFRINFFVLGTTWNLPKAMLVLFVSYIAGQILASPSSRIIERWLVHRGMKQPTVHLLADRTATGILPFIFPDYYNPLTPGLRDQIRRKLSLPAGTVADGEDIFWRTYPSARKDDVAKVRLATFLNLYGFCRNISFVAACSSLILLTQAIWMRWVEGRWVENERLMVGATLALLSIALFQRFLKFYRLYSVEVLVAFAKE